MRLRFSPLLQRWAPSHSIGSYIGLPFPEQKELHGTANAGAQSSIADQSSAALLVEEVLFVMGQVGLGSLLQQMLPHLGENSYGS